MRATAQSPLLTIGLHGHEHQRQSMMIDEWNRANLQTCYDLLSPLPNFVPFYALPFGRLEDWDMRALDDARALGLTLLTHNCGVNTTRTPSSTVAHPTEVIPLSPTIISTKSCKWLLR